MSTPPTKRVKKEEASESTGDADDAVTPVEKVTVIVSNFPLKWTKESVQSFLEPYGDFMIQKVESDKASKTATLWFYLLEDALRVKSSLHEQVTLDGASAAMSIRIPLLPSPPRSPSEPPVEEVIPVAPVPMIPYEPPICMPRPNTLEGHAKLFLGNLPFQLTDQDVQRMCEPYGEILEVKVLERKGCAFVIYRSVPSAMYALQSLNLTTVHGRKINVSFARPPRSMKASVPVSNFQTQSALPMGPVGSNLFVGGIPLEWTDDHLLNRFSAFGVVLNARISRDRQGHNKGFAFVHFQQPIFAQLAIQGLNGQEVAPDRTLRVCLRNEDIKSLQRAGSA